MAAGLLGELIEWMEESEDFLLIITRQLNLFSCRFLCSFVRRSDVPATASNQSQRSYSPSIRNRQPIPVCALLCVLVATLKIMCCGVVHLCSAEPSPAQLQQQRKQASKAGSSPPLPSSTTPHIHHLIQYSGRLHQTTPASKGRAYLSIDF